MTPGLVAELRAALGPEVSVAIRCRLGARPPDPSLGGLRPPDPPGCSGGPVVVSDGRPATPDTLRAALRVLVETVRRPELGGRSWAVVGELDVAESDRIRAHDEVGRLAVRFNVSRLVAVGLPTRAMHAGAVLEGSFGEESVHVPDAGSAVSLVLKQAGPREVVLVAGGLGGGALPGWGLGAAPPGDTAGGRDDELVATVTAALTAGEGTA